MSRQLSLCAATALFALAIACGKSNQAPTSPSSAVQGDSAAAPDGSTLKATAPVPVSPVNGAQPDAVVLVAQKSQMKFADVPLSYQFQIRSGSTVVYDSGVVGGVGSGNNVTHTVPSSALNPDTDYTWRVRASAQGAVGSWSSDGTFKSPVGAFIRGNEVRDPLTIGRTVGEIRGPAQFGPNGLTLIAHESHVLYRLPQTLQAGQFSMMILGADEGSEGDKSKVFAMQEGPDEGDITDDDYRMTAELRGNRYPAPGSVTFRIITGDALNSVHDGDRRPLNFSSSRWYFWSFVWRTGFAELTVRQDGPNGNIIYRSSEGTGTHPYRPAEHLVYLGAPIGRAGPMDATLPGGTYKNLWVSARPRPAFPGE